VSSAGSEDGADLIVVGAGLAGLTATAALADQGAQVLVLADVRRGEASPAAAGVLAPSVAPLPGPARAFALAARDYYPDYLAALQERTGVAVPLDRRGILEVAADERHAAALRGAVGAGSSWVDRGALRTLEPDLAHAAGALVHHADGAVDNLALLRALHRLLARHPRVRMVHAAAGRVTLRAGGAAVETRGGVVYSGERLVLAAGAWAPQLAGLPRALPVAPVRGQMMAVAFDGLRHVVFGGGGYAVPRADGRTLVGATSEQAGFDPSHTESGLAALRTIATAVSPRLGRSRTLSVWAGLRPMTPDLLPILGADPDWPALLYSCGHSRNGVLLAPLAGACLAAIARGTPPPLDVTPFRVERFTEQ
jgi:glycine oxidase